MVTTVGSKRLSTSLVPIGKNLLIRASAGSGKTFRLTNRFLELLFEDVAPSEILAVTFTRKAAGEIMHRALARLAQGAISAEGSKRLASEIGDSSITQARCLELLSRLLTRPDQLGVSTLDSFFVRLATHFSLELNLPLRWSIAETHEVRELQNEAIRKTLSDAKQSELIVLLRAILKGGVSRSIAATIRDTVDDLYEVAKETPPKAWEGLPDLPRLKLDEVDPLIAEIDAADWPKDKRWTQARQDDINRFINRDWVGFLTFGVAAKVARGEETYNRKVIDPDIRELYTPLVKHAVAALFKVIENQNRATRDLLEKFSTAYEEIKLKRRTITFNDLTRAVSLPNLFADQKRLDIYADVRFRHLLLDEFQDTSLSQWQVIQPLAAPLVRDVGNSSFFCVGDRKQAIYGWRGGVSGLIDHIEEDLGPLKTEILAESYRSAPAVIDVVNTLFTNLTNHSNLSHAAEAIAAWRNQFPVLTAAKKSLRGYVTLETCPVGEEGQQEDAMLAHAAKVIREICDQTPDLEIGVLVRKNATASRLIAKLQELGVALSDEGKNSLRDSPAVELILSLLTLIDHPGDTVAAFHVATSPLGEGIGFKDWSSADERNRMAWKLRESLLSQGYGSVVADWARHLAAECDRRDRIRLEQLLDLAYAFEGWDSTRTRDFVRAIETQTVTDPSSAKTRVMTIHQAKGLEFDVVVLPELTEGLSDGREPYVGHRPAPTRPYSRISRYVEQKAHDLFPEEFQKMFSEALAEEVTQSLCLLYVAVTRARHSLRMIVPPSSGSESNLPRDVAGLIRGALCGPGKALPETLLYEHGERDWHTPPTASSTTASSITASSITASSPLPSHPIAKTTTVAQPKSPSPRAKISFGKPSRRSVSVAPSSTEGSLTKGRSFEFPVRGKGERDALRMGTLIHACFELAKWSEDGLPSEASVRERLAREPDLRGWASDKFEHGIAMFFQSLRGARVSGMLRRNTYEDRSPVWFRAEWIDELASAGALDWKAETEWAFVVETKRGMMNGRMDRLVIGYAQGAPVAADIVDFKTDRFADEPGRRLRDRVTYYQPQLLAYRDAAAKLLRISPERVTTSLLFCFEDEMVRV